MFARGATLLLLVGAVSAASPWRRDGIPKSPPRGFGAALAYDLGGERELDQLGSVWYTDYRYTSEPAAHHAYLLLVNAGAKLDSVAARARARPGEWWQFGNEPNDPNQDSVSPGDYAGLYREFYLVLKRADSTARIVPAGIANADWTWTDAFRESYRERHGRYPTVDGWSIHNYLLDSCERALDVKTFQSRILAFRDWMERIGNKEKPLFLTEYGVLYGSGCCRCPNIPPGAVVDYMRATTRWLAATDFVQAWAWFAVNTGGRYNGDLFNASGELSLFGAAYRDLGRELTSAQFPRPEGQSSVTR